MRTILDNRKNLHHFIQDFNQKKEVSLYDFMFLLAKCEYKVNGWMIFWGFILVQVTLIAVLKGIFGISAPYEFYVMPGVFFFISSFTLYTMGLKMYLPYSVLKQEIQ